MNNIKKIAFLILICSSIKTYPAETECTPRKAIKAAMKISKLQQTLSKNQLIRKLIGSIWGVWMVTLIKSEINRNHSLSSFLAQFAGAYGVFTYLVIKYLSKEDALINEKCKVFLKDIPAEMLIDNTVAQ
jgi:hypothetical protein